VQNGSYLDPPGVGKLKMGGVASTLGLGVALLFPLMAVGVNRAFSQRKSPGACRTGASHRQDNRRFGGGMWGRFAEPTNEIRERSREFQGEDEKVTVSS